MNRKLFTSLFLALTFASILAFSSCDSLRAEKVEDTTWDIRVFWQSAQRVITVTFNEGGSLSCTDDTSGSYSGTWTENTQGTVSWTVDAEGRTPTYIGTYDRQKIEGNASDAKGDTGTFTGDRR